jgi:methylmalonyl-CoA mutase
LHALEAAGVPAVEALPYFGASITVDCDLSVSIAKLRALRLLWARLQELCGCAVAPIPVHAATSRRMMRGGDAEANLLRNIIAAAAAALGGADSILIHPHHASHGLVERQARRLSCNIHHLLIEEAHLRNVADAASGSGALEALTDALAERSWTEFQAIEREGGILASLRAGAFQARIAEMREGAADVPAAGEFAEALP